MDDAVYQSWRMALTDWLMESKPETAESTCVHPAAKPVLEVLAQARQTVAGINATLSDVKVLDLNKYDHLVSILDTVLALESFSLAEYTYNLPGDKHPGIRLWYEYAAGQSQTTLLLFEDVQEWRVDASGKKVSWQILRFNLSSGQPVPDMSGGAERFIPPGKDWRNTLNEALCLPLRLYHSS